MDIPCRVLRLAEHDHPPGQPRLTVLGPAERAAKGKARSGARRAVHDQEPAHEVGQLARDRKPEAGAAVAPGGRFVDLREALEDVLLGAQRDADAGVAHVDAQHHPVRLDRLGRHPDRDVADVGELDRVAGQIDQDLLQRARRAMKPMGQMRVDRQAQVQALVARLVMQQRTHRRQQHVQIEGRRPHGHGAGFDLGDVQKIADHLQQSLAGAAYGAHHVLLLDAQRAGAQQIGHADDRVQRRAQLMAHGGQKAALGPIGFLGARHGVRQLGQERQRIGWQHEQSDPEAGGKAPAACASIPSSRRPGRS